MARSRSGSRTLSLAFVVGLAALLAAGAAQAQQWEFTLSPLYQMGQTIDFEGGSTVTTDDELGFGLGFGYRFNEQFTLGFGFDWYSVGYDAEVVRENPAGITGITGDYDSWLTWVNLQMNFMEGPFTPFISAGIGYSYIDTGIPDGRPIDGCWWDPWYGYICGSYYPTKTSSDFTYQAGVGLRYQFNPMFFGRLAYEMRWLDLGEATSTPSFDQIRLDFGWVF